MSAAWGAAPVGGEYQGVSPDVPRRVTFTCSECGRVFDLTDPTDADEWAHGHDCEAF